MLYYKHIANIVCVCVCTYVRVYSDACCASPLQFLEEDLDEEEAQRELSPSTSLKFNNNMLNSWDGFASTVRGLLLNPLQLAWVDLSFNDLRSISSVSEFIAWS